MRFVCPVLLALADLPRRGEVSESLQSPGPVPVPPLVEQFWAGGSSSAPTKVKDEIDVGHVEGSSLTVQLTHATNIITKQLLNVHKDNVQTRQK